MEGRLESDPDPYAGLVAGNWTAIYEAEYDYATEARGITRLLGEAGVGPAETLFELGCGTGSLAIELARLGQRVDIHDRSPAMTEIARRRIAERELASVRVLEATPGDEGRGAYGAVVMQRAAPARDEFLEIVALARRLLRRGGIALLPIWSSEQISEWLDPGHSVTLDLNPGRRAARLCTWGPDGAERDAMTFIDIREMADGPAVQVGRLILPVVQREWAAPQMTAAGFTDVRDAEPDLGFTLRGRAG